MDGTGRPPPGRITDGPARPDDGARKRRRDRLAAGAFTLAAHLIVIAALLLPRAAPPPPPAQPPSLMLSLVEAPKPAPPAPPLPDLARLVPVQAAPAAPPRIAVRVASVAAPDNSDLLSEAQLAGAASADGEGGGGGGCDTARLVQQALQRDPLVRASVEEAHRLGKAVMLWNGDWVRSGAQDGKGLSAVREAIVWELAFAPQACRNQPVHGMVVLSLADGGTRFAVGAGDWRWSDLLHVHGAAPER